MVLTESFASSFSIFSWCCLISHFYSQFVILIYTQFPYLTHTVSLPTIHRGAGVLHQPKPANPREGKSEKWYLLEIGQNCQRKQFHFLSGICHAPCMEHLKLHTWPFETIAGNATRKCKPLHTLPSAPAEAIFHGPRLETKIRLSGCPKYVINKWAVSHPGGHQTHVRHGSLFSSVFIQPWYHVNWVNCNQKEINPYYGITSCNSSQTPYHHFKKRIISHD